MEKKPVNRKVFALFIVIVVVLVVGIALFGVNKKTKNDNPMSGMNGQSSNSSSQNNAQATATNSVAIDNYAFSPASITVKKGTKVTWTNNDSVQHTVTVDNGDGPKSDLFGKGQTYSYTFNTAGSFSYHCEPHPYMKGTVTVTE